MDTFFDLFIVIWLNLSKPNLHGTNFCVRNRLLFGLYRLSSWRLPSCWFDLQFGYIFFYRILEFFRVRFVRLLSLNNLIWLTIIIISLQYKFPWSYSFSVHNSESKSLSKTLVILKLVPKGSPQKGSSSSARHLPIYKSHFWT